MERNEFFDRLLLLTGPPFEFLLRQMDVAHAYLSSDRGPHATRVVEFLHVLAGRGGKEIWERLRVELAQAEQMPSAAASIQTVDGELDEIKGLLESHDYALAKSLMERIERQRWGSLPVDRQTRLHLQKGYVHLAQGDHIAAAMEYLNAARLAARDEKPRTGEALAYELLEDAPRAHELAEKLIAEFPLSSRSLAIWLRTFPPEHSAEALEQLAAARRLALDGEVWLAVASRALNQQDFVRAQRLSRRVVELDPDWPPGWLFLGLTLSRSVLREEEPRFPLLSMDAQERLREAVASFTKASDLAEREKRVPIQIEALVGCARALDLLGETKAAEGALHKADRLKPDDGPILFWLGAFLREHGRPQEAVEILERSLRLQANPQTEFLLALALSSRKGDEDRARATALFAQVARTAQHEFRVHALKFAIHGYRATKDFDTARRLLDENQNDAFSSVLHQALSGLVSFDAAELVRAGTQADAALQAWTLPAEPVGTGILASLLSQLNRHADALPLWESLFDPNTLGQDEASLLSCAQTLERDDILIDACQRLREARTASSAVQQLEFSLLERYEPASAAVLLKDYVEQHPDDHVARLALISCKLRTGQINTADLELDQLPTAKDIDPIHGEMVVRLLAENGRQSEAREYAYQLVRAHYNSVKAHQAFCLTFFHLAVDQGAAEVSIPQVQPGVAVAYLPEGQANIEWIVIEEGSAPQYNLDEYPPSHPWCQQVIGKSPGDKIPMPGSRLPEQYATLKAIHSKYAYRLRDSFQRMTKAFADKTGWAQINTPKIDKKDLPPATTLKPLLDHLELVAQQDQLVFEQYRTYHLPVQVFGALSGRSAFNAVLALIQRDGFGLYCWSRIPAVEEATRWLQEKPLEVVVELTAIVTLFALGRLSLLQSPDIKFIVSQSTVEELRAAVRESRPNSRQVGSVATTDRGIRWIESTPEGAQQRHDEISRLLETITAYCELQSGRPLAYAEPEKRNLMCSWFGQHGAESLVLAKERNSLLWTDDATVALYGTQKLGIRRLWTQAMIESLLAGTDEQSRINSTAKLVGWGYQQTIFGLDVIRYAGDLVEWQPQAFPLRQMIALFAEEVTSLERCVEAMRALIIEIEQALIVNTSAQATYRIMLTNVRRRPGGEGAVRDMLARLPSFIRESMRRAGSLTMGDAQ